jgi:hypothetical protein
MRILIVTDNASPHGRHLQRAFTLSKLDAELCSPSAYLQRASQLKQDVKVLFVGDHPLTRDARSVVVSRYRMHGICWGHTPRMASLHPIENLGDRSPQARMQTAATLSSLLDDLLLSTRTPNPEDTPHALAADPTIAAPALTHAAAGRAVANTFLNLCTQLFDVGTADTLADLKLQFGIATFLTDAFDAWLHQVSSDPVETLSMPEPTLAEVSRPPDRATELVRSRKLLRRELRLAEEDNALHRELIKLYTQRLETSETRRQGLERMTTRLREEMARDKQAS